MIKANLDMFRVYPRGFLGALMGLRVEKKASLPQPRMAYQSNLSLIKPQITVADPNPNVDALYAQRLKGTADSFNLDFNKRLLITALNAFGTTDFKYWFEQQHVSPTAGDNHRLFLEDTLKFISSGKRELNPLLWGRIITMEDSTDRLGVSSQVARDFFVGYGQGRPASVINILQDWMSQVGGEEDLLLTLHVLFGNV